MESLPRSPVSTAALLIVLAIASSRSANAQIRFLKGRQALFGTSLDIADMDGDGKPEFLVGSPASPGVTGRIEIYSHDLKRLAALSGPDGFGLSATFLGDTDRDGHRDYAIGALDQVMVVSGKRTSLLGVFKGPRGMRYGTVVAAAGDVDKDGYADLLIGAPAFRTPLGEVGAAEVRSGRTGGILHRFFGDTRGARMGRGLATAGDVDGDGHDDLLVGSPGARTVHCFSGKTGKVIHKLAQPGHDLFGYTVKGGRDLDGDGTPDIAVGAPDLPGAKTNPSVMLFSGKTGARRFVLGGSRGSWFGYALSLDADTNGDGQYDILVGSPGIDTFRGGFASFSGKDGKRLVSFLSRITGSMGSTVIATKSLIAVGVPAFEKGYVQFFPGRLKPTVVEQFGTACSSGTAPSLTGTSTASYGGSFLAELRVPKRPLVALLVIGTSKTSWRGAKLPLNLGFMGAPGCHLYASWDVAIPFFELSTNRASFRATLPIKKHEAFMQALVYDAKANAAGIGSTRALRITGA